MLRVLNPVRALALTLSPFGTQLLSREAAPNLSWSPDAADSGASGRLFPLVSFLSPPLLFSLFLSLHLQPFVPAFSSPLPPSPTACSFLPPLLLSLFPSLHPQPLALSFSFLRNHYSRQEAIQPCRISSKQFCSACLLSGYREISQGLHFTPRNK